MSFHFPQVFPLISDRSVWHNGKHPEVPVVNSIRDKLIQTKNKSVCEIAVTGIRGSCRLLVRGSWLETIEGKIRKKAVKNVYTRKIMLPTTYPLTSNTASQETDRKYNVTPKKYYSSFLWVINEKILFHFAWSLRFLTEWKYWGSSETNWKL